MSDDPVPVIIPVFNRPEYALACLEALSANDAGARIMPVIVDNGSRLRTKNALAGWAARAEGAPPPWLAKPMMLALPENRGFAGGLNAGLRAIMPCRRAFIMHDDCVPFEGWVGEMLACLDQGDEECAVVVPMTNYANEHSMCDPEVRARFEAVKIGNKIRATEDDIKGMMATTYPDGVPAFLDNLRKAEPRFQYSPEIASFCMLVRGDILDKYGLFDEEFFPRGYEDSYWFIPAAREGFVVMIAKRAWIHHFGNVTSDSAGWNFGAIMQANKERFDAKCKARDAARCMISPEHDPARAGELPRAQTDETGEIRT